MKTYQNFFRMTMIVSFAAFFLNSCSDNTDAIETVNLTAQETTELARAAEVDAASSAIEDIVIEVFQFDEANPNGRVQPPNLPDCVTITVTAQQNYREVIINFGSEGCLVRGHILKGQIEFSYTHNPEAQNVLVTYDLVGFYYDNKNILGNRTILRERENENGNPQFTHTLDLTVIWPSGVEASRSGTKIREWVEGAGSGVFSDNVFEVTGNWNTSFINGNTHSYEVITPLRREVVCTYFVSGTVDVQRTNFGGTFNYGNGECDNMATFTFNNGTEVNITLN